MHRTTRGVRPAREVRRESERSAGRSSCPAGVRCRRHHLRAAAVVAVLGEAVGQQQLHRSADCGQRDQEPLARLHRGVEAVAQLEVQPGFGEEAVQQLLELEAVDVGQLPGRHHLDPRQQEGRVLRGVRDALLHAPAGHAELVDRLAVRREEGLVGSASKGVDEARAHVALVELAGGEQRRRGGVGGEDAAAGVVLVRASEASGAAAATGCRCRRRPGAACRGCRCRRRSLRRSRPPAPFGRRARRGRPPGCGVRSPRLEGRRHPHARRQLGLHRLEPRLEGGEVLALVPLGHLLGGPLLRGGADVLQRRHAGGVLGLDAQRLQQLVVGVVGRGRLPHGVGGFRQQPAGVERGEQRPHLLALPHPVEPDGVDPLEDVLAAVARRPPVRRRRNAAPPRSPRGFAPPAGCASPASSPRAPPPARRAGRRRRR